MRNKAGLRTNETARDSDLDWLDSASQDYSDVEDCDDWKFDFYAINKHTYKYVFTTSGNARSTAARTRTGKRR